MGQRWGAQAGKYRRVAVRQRRWRTRPGRQRPERAVFLLVRGLFERSNRLLTPVQHAQAAIKSEAIQPAPVASTSRCVCHRKGTVRIGSGWLVQTVFVFTRKQPFNGLQKQTKYLFFKGFRYEAKK